MMTKTRKTFLFSEAEQLVDLIPDLGEQYRLDRIHDATVACIWLDTFDWRLYQRGLVLTAITQPQNLIILTLSQLDSGDVLARCITNKLPEFTEDLTKPGFVERIGSLLHPRKLLKQLSLESTGTHWQIGQKNDELCLNLTAQKLDFLTASSETPSILVATPIVDKEKPAKKILKDLVAAFEWEPISFQKQTEYLFRTGNVIPLSTKLQPVTLQPDESVTAATRKILLQQLDIVEANLAGTLIDVDSEFLHDLRVALRRSRSVLSAFREYFPRAKANHFISELKWAFRETNPNRDTDVNLLSIGDYSAALSTPYSRQLGPLETQLKKQKDEFQPRLVSHLQSGRFRKFLSDWRAFLETDIAAQNELPSIAEVATGKIRKTFKKLIRQGEGLDDSSPPGDFHELRKLAKKHRYLLALFGSLYPASTVKPQITALKKLQDVLGSYQDMQVQITEIISLGRQMHLQRSCGADTLMAMGVLTEHLRNRQVQARAAFEPRFRDFNTAQIRQLYKRLETSK